MVDYAMQSQANPKITNQQEFHKEDLKEISDIIDLTNEETNINTYSAEDHETKRFKNAVVSSAMQSQMITDRQKHYPDEDSEDDDEMQLDPSQEDNIRQVCITVQCF